MSLTSSRPAGVGLPVNYPIILPTGQIVVGSGPIALAAGSVWFVPAGQFYIVPGPYSFLQYKDPILGLWRTPPQVRGAARFVTSDGTNVRLANLSGCALGAFVTNVGSGYTSAPVVTANGTGASTWTAIVGGAINSTVTVTTAGTYNYPPIIHFDPPPPGGVQATAIAVMSGTAISSVTVIDQGAGYSVAPKAYLRPDPRDTAAGGGVLTVNATLAGAGTITAVVCTNHGIAVTSVPSLTFTGGGGASAAATPVMCLTATGFTVGAGGAAYGNAQPFGIITIGGVVGGSAGAVVNPSIGPSMFAPVQANISGTSTAGGAITATGLVINDGGIFQAVPNALVIAGGSGLATTVGQATITVGGVTDVSEVAPF